MKYIVKIYKNKGKILVEKFDKEDTAQRWAANAINNGYAVLAIIKEGK